MENYPNRLQAIDNLQRETAARRPLKGDEFKELKEYYRIGLTWSSNALEGNSLTEVETKVVLEDRITVGGKPLRHYFEAVGHSDAFDLLYQLFKRQGVTEADILKLHRLFYRHVDEKNAGKYRKKKILVTGARLSFPLPEDLKEKMADFVREMEQKREVMHPVEFAAELHLGLVTIHPFVDGNGRTARLLMNLALMQRGYPVTIIPPILRGDYIEAIQKANVGDHQPFRNFISCMVWESQREYLRLLDSLSVE
jgi:Fic family protein